MNFQDFVKHCVDNAAYIFVKEQLTIGGKPDNYSLAQLPFPLAMTHVNRWYLEGQLPYRVVGLYENQTEQ